MLSRQTPAKINLGLHVLRRRLDGYHDLESVLLPIHWCDTITVERSDTFAMTCSDLTLPADERNLCLQAAHMLAEEAGFSGGVQIHLEKQIPHGAGLGGGSSDAAATLQLLEDLWQLPHDPDRLRSLAARIGSDVPFFLERRPMFVQGRGTEMELLDEAYEFPFHLVVAKPPVAMSTADAYGLVTPRSAGRPDLRELVTSNDPQRWNDELVNDFEPAVFEIYPEIADLKRWFYRHDAAYASLTGSGTAVYGVYADAAAAEDAADDLKRREGYRVWIGA